jgi:hypothetical protein
VQQRGIGSDENQIIFIANLRYTNHPIAILKCDYLPRIAFRGKISGDDALNGSLLGTYRKRWCVIG